ncbi:spermidine synthase [SAR202 cluster bacterium AD-802-E10_MRT_200m]|nr:spermidine synthase [SAR202 cluster bacterium AD-802-E10_MRT_200m]
MSSSSGENGKLDWRYEPITPGLSYACAVQRVVHVGSTRYQNVELIETEPFGLCLVLDGKIQSAASDEFIYHESLVHPVLTTHPRPESVCIAGGGEGSTAREVLRHSHVKRLVMVDLDEELVGICRKHLTGFHQGAFDDPRLQMYFDDIRSFLLSYPDYFDVIILDLPDPMKDTPTAFLYTLKFYQTLRARLKPGGMLVTQAGPATLLNHQEVFTAIHNTLEMVFPTVVPYTVQVDSFGETWGFVFASFGPSPLKLSVEQVNSSLMSDEVFGLRCYDGIQHQGLFSLPQFLRAALQNEDRIITEQTPVFIY